MAQSEDRPIIVGGGPQMITIELPPSFRNLTEKGKFTVAPKDSAVPFKTIVVMKGGNKVLDMPLDVEWTITIE